MEWGFITNCTDKTYQSSWECNLKIYHIIPLIILIIIILLIFILIIDAIHVLVKAIAKQRKKIKTEFKEQKCHELL